MHGVEVEDKVVIAAVVIAEVGTVAVVPDVMRVSDLPVAFVKPVTVGTVVGCIVFVPVPVVLAAPVTEDKVAF